MVLGRAVQGERGELMLAAQIVLNERFIALLQDRGFAAVYIEDPDTNDLEIEDVVSERVQAKITVGVSRVFEAMEQAATPFKNPPGGRCRGATSRPRSTSMPSTRTSSTTSRSWSTRC